ncbi:hypothetical protein DUNSADRAFT_5551, partial [Dunaliella salina]
MQGEQGQASMGQEHHQPSTSGQPELPTLQAADAAGGKKSKRYEPLELPHPMRIVQEDFMNNCFIKSGLSYVMGGLAGGAFGLFTASIENSGGVRASIATFF